MLFNEGNRNSLQQRLAELTPEERDTLESAQEDDDLISWFNRTKITDEDRKLKMMRGSFYKVRAQGSATDRDCEEINKIYKRGFVSCAVAFGHAYALV